MVGGRFDGKVVDWMEKLAANNIRPGLRAE
jgi:hypothetical protein